jgi:predicted nucleic acid-binding protein
MNPSPRRAGSSTRERCRVAGHLRGDLAREWGTACSRGDRASWLPENVLAGTLIDPGDRLIVATARHLGLPVVTRDRNIIAYARNGDVGVIPC